MANCLLLIRPAHFGYNNETAASNIFQKNIHSTPGEIGKQALAEFDNLVLLLDKYHINNIVVEGSQDTVIPDEIFPNNWFSTHHDGKVFLYPMLAPSRRLERREDIFDLLKKKYNFHIKEIKSFADYERKNMFLEGTGAIVFDHRNKTAFANLSSRCNKIVAEKICDELQYKPVTFSAKSKDGKEIYHTNVMMAIGENYAVICDESISNGSDRDTVLRTLISTGHEIISISHDQMEKFAGNMLAVKNQHLESITVMSDTAFNCLNEGQTDAILKHSKILPVPIPTIETVGGGSVRCMLAEIFLPTSKNN